MRIVAIARPEKKQPMIEHNQAATWMISVTVFIVIITGSIASIIVVEAASRYGMTIAFREFARTGVPVTLVSLLVAAGWPWLTAASGISELL